jgi:hypothetical protein
MAITTTNWARSVRGVVTGSITEVGGVPQPTTGDKNTLFDGLTPNPGANPPERWLLTKQATATLNGIWIYNGVGANMTRPADDFNNGLPPTASVSVIANEGATFANTTHRLLTLEPNGGFTINAGTGAANSGLTFARQDTLANVKDFGAKGDGGTNDYSAIKNALASVPPGGTLFFPPGTYVVGPPIVMMPINSQTAAVVIPNDNITLQGVAGASIIKAWGGTLDAADAVAFSDLLYALGRNGVKVIDLVFDVNQGARAAQLASPTIGVGFYPMGTSPMFGNGISFVNCNDCLFQNVVVKNTIGLTNGSAHAFGNTQGAMGNSVRMRYSHCIAQDCGTATRQSDGWYLQGERIVVDTCIAEGCTDVGFVFEQCNKSGGTNLRAVNCGTGGSITTFGTADVGGNFFQGFVIGTTGAGTTTSGIAIGMPAAKLDTDTGNLRDTLLSNIVVDNSTSASYPAVNALPNLRLELVAISVASNPGDVVIDTSPYPHGFLDLDRVSIAGATGNVAINGRWIVSYISPTTFKIKNPTTLAFVQGNGVYAGAAKAQRPVAITTASFATPVIITANDHGFAAGNLVNISGVQGNPAANGQFVVAAPITANTFALHDASGGSVVGLGLGTGGVAFVGPRIINLRISNLTVSNAGQQGVVLANCDKATITGGSIAANDSPLRITGFCTDIKVEGVSIYAGSVATAAVPISAGCDNIMIGGCNILGKASGTPWGVYCYGPSTNVRTRADNSFSNVTRQVGGDTNSTPRSSNDVVFFPSPNGVAGPSDSTVGIWPKGAVILNTNPAAPGQGPFGWHVTSPGIASTATLHAA